MTVTMARWLNSTGSIKQNKPQIGSFVKITKICFYPTALKGCRDIVFTLVSGWVGGWLGGGKKFVRPISRKP